MIDTHSTKLIIMFVLATFVTAGNYEELCTKYEYAIYSDRRFDGAVFRQLRNTTKRQCEKDCHGMSMCQSINYNKLELFCQINWRAVSKSDLLKHSRHWEYVHKQTLLQAYGVGCPTTPCPSNNMCVSLTSRLKTCVAIDCGLAPAGKNARPLVSRTTAIGHSVKYQCKSNHYFVDGNNRRECMANGQLSGQDIACVKFQCGKVFSYPVIRSHEIKCFASGHCRVTYTCTSGRRPVVGCSPSGQWSTLTIHC